MPDTQKSTQPTPVDSPVDETTTSEDNQTPVGKIHPLNLEKSTKTNTLMAAKKTNPKLLITLLIIAVVAGVGTGYGSFKLYAQSAGPDLSQIEQVATEGSVAAGDVFGSADTSTFKDSAEGYLESGGVNGEGTHRLLRPGGEAQTVSLTSSVTDLEALVGMDVKIWGETFKGQRSGWLMDVGRVEVVRVEGDKPIMD
ncbi:MAG: hypothetical protein WDZ94_00690 [Patescibacteria group bacterium]